MNRPPAATLGELVRRCAGRHPATPFVTDLVRGEVLTYGRLPGLAGAWARLLREVLPASREGRVAYCADNHWSVHPLIMACAAVGLGLAPISPRITDEEKLRIVKDAECGLFIHESPDLIPVGLPTRVRPLALDALLVRRGEEEGGEEGREESAADPHAPLLIIYTSGTTGACKGVELTAHNLLTDAVGIVGFYGLHAGDRMLCVLPCYHMNALMITGMVPLTAGAEVVLGPVFGFRNAKNYLNQVGQRGITVMSLTPSIMAMLLRLHPAPRDMAAAGVRFAFCGAAPLKEELWRRFEEHFNIPVHQGYGLTETTCWATCSLPTPHKDYRAVGVPVNCSVRIDSPRPDEAGEVLIAGPIVMQGYHKLKSPITAEGYLRTGDIGCFNPRGELAITGRIKDIIKKNGLNIFPQEIERVLDGHPAIAECATVGIEDELVGEAVHSACVLHPGQERPSEAAVRAWAGERLSGFMTPDRIHFVGQLPKGETGKVNKPRLRAMLSGQVAQQAVAVFDTWKYKRCRLSDPAAITALVQQAVLAGEPVRFLKYWGAGDKGVLGGSDRRALDRLGEIINGIGRVHPRGGELLLLFTDMHARLNGKDPACFQGYLAQVEEYAREMGFAVVRSSALWQAHGLSLEVLATTLPGLGEWLSHHPLRGELLEQAGKHSRQLPPEEAALLYAAACQEERDLYARLYADRIFLTYNSREHDLLIPPLPRVYLYSHRTRSSEKPWFVDDGGVS